MSKASQFLSK